MGNGSRPGSKALFMGYLNEGISEESCGCRYFATGIQTHACDQHAENGHEGDSPDSDDDQLAFDPSARIS